MKLSAPPSTNKQSISESFYNVVETLCNRFIGLSPFEVINAETRDVYDLFVDVVIYDSKNKKAKEGWVSSKTATWH